MNESTTYTGSCHCGAIAFEAEGSIEQLIECNCSICERKGVKMWFVPEAHFRLLSPEAELATYTFNEHRINHHFCPTCGIHPFARSTGKDGEVNIAVNARCLDGLEIDAIPVRHFDGSKL